MDAEALVAPVVEAAGLELVEVTFNREGGRRVLRVVVDRDGGVDLDTISDTAQKVSRRLDLEGFTPGPYQLEVSSPGIERSLREPTEFGRRVGDRVKIRTTEQVAGARTHVGALVSADAEAIVVATDGGEVRVPYDQIASARTVADWDAELKRSGVR
ncbi:MAG: ribosome maturation factor RimP [Actinomycetota bacterium]